jgi:hypothetical protein
MKLISTRLPSDRSVAGCISNGAARCTSSKREKSNDILEAHMRRLPFVLPLPDGDNEKKDRQSVDRKWRALSLAIKSNLESVESHIETFEESFLAHIVMPDGVTVGKHAHPGIGLAYKAEAMPPLLTTPPKK